MSNAPAKADLSLRRARTVFALLVCLGLVEETRFDQSRSMESYQEVRNAKRLFPEAAHVEVYPDVSR